jgi:hypothetical protein
VSITQEAPSAVSDRGASGVGVQKKRRSGSENRQRNRHKKLSLLPTEEQVLQQLADEKGLNIQQFILTEFVAPLMATAK